MCDALAEMRDMEVVEPIVTLRSRMHKEDIASLRALASALVK